MFVFVSDYGGKLPNEMVIYFNPYMRGIGPAPYRAKSTEAAKVGSGANARAVVLNNAIDGILGVHGDM